MKICKLKNSDGTLVAEILPDHAGCINRLSVIRSVGVVDIIDGYSSDEELIANKGSKSSLLAPFPNRIRDGKFTFNSVEYQFPINMPNENNAIHGFVENENFEVVEHSEDTVRLSYEYAGTRDYFPFPFSIKIDYGFEDNKLSCKTIVKNIGKNELPFGLGWHPYFKIGKNVDDLKLQIPSANEIDVDDRLLPTGNLREFLKFKEPQLIATNFLDTGFVVSDNRKETRLINDELGIQVIVENGEGFDYLQIYTPPDRKSIAIEPMTCEADALNTKKGLRVLAPGEFFLATYSIEVR
jgi:aldose 1-epimerase